MKGIEKITEMDFMIDSDQLDLIMTLLDVKNATDIEVFTDDREDLEELRSFLNQWDVEFRIVGATDTDLEGFYGVMGEEEEVEEMLDSEFVRRVYVNRDQELMERYVSWRESWRNMMFRRGALENRFHRLAGEFYGFPEEDIEAFLYRNSSDLGKLYLELKGGAVKDISVDEALEKYGDLDEDEEKYFRNFTQHILADSSSSFERQLELVRKRRKVLEKNDVLLDRYLWSF